MAISKTLYFNGITVTDAYIRVWRVECEKASMTLCASFHAEKDAQAFDRITMYSAYDVNGANPIAQAYGYLKTLPEFAGAVDC